VHAANRHNSGAPSSRVADGDSTVVAVLRPCYQPMPVRPEHGWRRGPGRPQNTEGAWTLGLENGKRAAETMVPNWKALLPHRPLESNSDQYVPSPAGNAEHIAEWIQADRTTVLVAGPVGIGKSTELARAASLLQGDRIACLVRLDRVENMRRVTPEQVLLRLAGRLASLAIEQLKLDISRDLIDALARAKVLNDPSLGSPGSSRGFTSSAEALLRLTVSEVADASRQKRVALLIDGLEKMPPVPATQDVLDAIGAISEDVDLVAVLPWHAAFGANPESVLRLGEHLVALRAIDVEGEPGIVGREFFHALLARRLGISTPPPPEVNLEVLMVIAEAVQMSGGVPRTFLQLVADAATYARLRRGEQWPDSSDLALAVAEQCESFRRILQPGDTKEILAVAGREGRELAIDRKIRLLAHGVLLERIRGGAPVLDVHPLVEKLIGLPRHD
jgi:hypothetical protein